MSLPEPSGAFYPTEDQIRDQLLRAVRLAYRRRGKTVNVKPGSDQYITATSMARLITVAFGNSKFTLRDVSPLTAVGDNLRLICKVYGVLERPAASSSGFVIIATVNGNAAIPVFFLGTGPNGLKYQTVASGVFGNGASVQLQAKDAGAATDLNAGDIITWDSASIGVLKATATVDSAGFNNGSDPDTDDTLRARLLDRIAFPGAGGNWSQVKGWAEDASSAIESAFPYSAVRGPGSVDVAITKAGGNRALSATVALQAKANIEANLPGYGSVNVTPVQSQLVDIVVAAKLPLPTFAGGAGGGWRDAVPWPTENVVITGISGSTLSVTATVAPALGKHIAIWNPDIANISLTSWAPGLTEFVITSTPTVIGGGFSFDIAPLQSGALPSWIEAGMYVSAGAESIITYATELFAAMLKLGPGEKTDNPDILPRALRQPTPDIAWQSDLTSTLLSTVSIQHSEVLSFDWFARFITGTTTTITSPPLPPTTADAPFVLRAKHIAFIKG